MVSAETVVLRMVLNGFLAVQDIKCDWKARITGTGIEVNYNHLEFLK